MENDMDPDISEILLRLKYPPLYLEKMRQAGITSVFELAAADKDDLARDIGNKYHASAIVAGAQSKDKLHPWSFS